MGLLSLLIARPRSCQTVVVDFLALMGDYLKALFSTTGAVMALDGHALHEMGRFIWSVPIGIALIAGISTMIGQVVVLTINRVKGFRRFLTLIAAGLLLILNGIVQALIGALLTGLLLPARLRAADLLPAILASLAPFWLGFLIMLAYTGPGIARILQVWNLLALWSLLTVQLDTSPGIALVIAGGAWLGSLLVSWIVDHSQLDLRERVFRLASGTRWVTSEDLMDAAVPTRVDGGRP